MPQEASLQQQQVHKRGGGYFWQWLHIINRSILGEVWSSSLWWVSISDPIDAILRQLRVSGQSIQATQHSITSETPCVLHCHILEASHSSSIFILFFLFLLSEPAGARQYQLSEVLNLIMSDFSRDRYLESSRSFDLDSLAIIGLPLVLGHFVSHGNHFLAFRTGDRCPEPYQFFWFFCSNQENPLKNSTWLSPNGKVYMVIDWD